MEEATVYFWLRQFCKIDPGGNTKLQNVEFLLMFPDEMLLVLFLETPAAKRPKTLHALLPSEDNPEFCNQTC